MMWVGIALHLAIAALVGLAVVRFGQRFLPGPWKRATFTVPMAVVIGALITLASLTHWSIFPK